MSLKAQDVYAILNSKIGEGGSGTGGTTNYNDLQNKPKINNVELTGNKTLEDLGIQAAGNYLTEDDLPDVPEIDETLSVSGKAADAKVVGDKFTELDGDIEDINEDISGIKTDLANTSDAIISEAEGETILVNDSGEKGFSGLKVYGWSKQDGTPSPENPVPIVSAGDEGEINVTVQGGNLIQLSEANLKFAYGLTGVINSDGSLTVNGTPISRYAQVYSEVLPLDQFPPGTYTISGGEANPGRLFAQIAITLSSGTKRYFINNHFTIDGTEKEISLQIQVDDVNLTPVENYQIYPVINAGSTALPYMPYKQPQTLVLSTPGGLPGIPVSSGGNYTDESGQQWICDEVDFKRGKYVKRVWRHTFDGSEGWLLYTTSGLEGFNFNVLPEVMNTRDGLSNQLSKYTGGDYSQIPENSVRFGANNTYVYCVKNSFYDASLEDSGLANWKAHLAAHPLEVMTYLDTPIETDLSDEEIAAYQFIHTYKPTTTIQNDSSAYMEVEYVKDIEKYIDDTTNEIVDSAIDNYDTEIKSFVDTNYVKKTDLETNQEKLEKYIESYYAMKRNGNVYQTKLWKFATNPISTGEKLLSNAGLTFEPSTDTTEGQDDYLNGQHPMFEWVNVNYVRDDDGTARPIAIEGMDNYVTSGSVDVGVMQMSFYWKWDTSNAEYDLITVSDSPHPELGLEPWPECVKEDGTVLPWCIGSKYISGIASDGLLRSQPGLKPERKQSHNNMITNYQLKGAGYWGAGAVRNLFQIVFNAIKGATKNSQTLYQGVTNWSYQYEASVQRTENLTYFPVTNAQAANLIVGNYVSVGYGYNNNGTINIDRGNDNLHMYVDDVRILSIETLDENNKAVYLDIDTGFNTTPVTLTEELTAPIVMSTMHAWSGMTDSVLGKHDGSPVSNTNAKYPYRVQGREYAVGGYIVASDTVMDNQSDYSKKVYVAEKGTTHTSTDATIRSTYKEAGTIPASTLENNGDWYIGDISVDMDTGVWYPSVPGSSNTQGYGDRVYTGGTGATSGMREYLQGGDLGNGSAAGSACLICWGGLGAAYWYFLGCD